MNWKARSVWIGFFCCFREHSRRRKSKSIFWRDLATTHYAGATADLLAEAEVHSGASDTNVRTSFSGGGDPSRIFYRCLISKCTIEIEQHRLTKYYTALDSKGYGENWPTAAANNSEGAIKARAAGGAPRRGRPYPTMKFSWQMFIIYAYKVLLFWCQGLRRGRWLNFVQFYSDHPLRVGTCN